VSTEPCDAAFLQFVTDHLRGLDDLHMLLAMAGDRDRWWDGVSAARELGTDRSTAGRVLEHLAAENLLDIRVTDDVRYRFRPGRADLDRAAQACVEAYRSRPIALWRAAEEALRVRSIQEFADAFRLKPDVDR
jgi:hypothetical protein